VKRLLATAVVFCAALAALGRGASAAGQSLQAAHPAVVRVTVAERGAISYGSGALVAVDETLGLVVTNWHVVRDAAGQITVSFPDGFRSTATVLAVDRDWDLAALAVRRPNVQPIALSREAPKRGELLTIAGYGQGSYRASTGRCTQYVSPGRGLPFEMVELDAAARQGDSGGPILNHRGELAGVLFGAGFGRTAGSYCGRVGIFLDAVGEDFQQLSSQATMIAQQSAPAGATAGLPSSAGRTVGQRDISRPEASPVAAISGSPYYPPAADAARQSPPSHELAELPVPRPYESPTGISPPAAISATAQPPASQPPAPSQTDQIKTILAAIGVLAIAYHALRLLGAAA
jgi:hypothetical protein